VPVEAMYLDKMHPTARGHEALARALRDFLASRKLLPETGSAAAGGPSAPLNDRGSD
jgi:hypothetical protein